MNLYEQFQTDKTLEKEGIFLEYGTNSKGKPIRFRIARAGGANVKFAKRLEAELKPFNYQLKNGSLDPELGNKLLRKVFAETVVLGWEGVEDENGQDMPFNAENCVKLFTDLPDLYADVKEQSDKGVLFRVAVREEAAKN